ncbi:hypothetical protein AYL99_00405 [Fonsecaea erecta]|uniref:Peptidase S54 rhomboid domain-containing protein n=1 Tax=Fonsecaea erecta TaxID=1367422 RepID=A0A178ZYY7_9EURO|nr:hypothetical protein AYL99_00405 [Fonsecaea erecta]OAP64433.1 hypothetical protein AYL99_00405 [Fonsecaea erecta]
MQNEYLPWRRVVRSLEQRQTLQSLHTHFTLKLTDIQWYGRWWTLITPAFSHMQVGHAVGNLVAFMEFSQMLLAAGIHPAHYGALILGSAVSGHLAFLTHVSWRRATPWWWTLLPLAPRVEPCALGLSGVVTGLGVALALAAPNATATTTVVVLSNGRTSLPAWGLIVLYLIYDTARLDDLSSEFGYVACLGGAAFGAVFYFFELRGRNALPFVWRL